MSLEDKTLRLEAYEDEESGDLVLELEFPSSFYVIRTKIINDEASQLDILSAMIYKAIHEFKEAAES